MPLGPRGVCYSALSRLAASQQTGASITLTMSRRSRVRDLWVLAWARAKSNRLAISTEGLRQRDRVIRNGVEQDIPIEGSRCRRSRAVVRRRFPWMASSPRDVPRSTRAC